MTEIPKRSEVLFIFAKTEIPGQKSWCFTESWAPLRFLHNQLNKYSHWTSWHSPMEWVLDLGEQRQQQPLSKKRSARDFNNYSVVGYKLCLSMYLCMYVCMYVIYVCMYVSMHACMYVCMHACMYVRTYVCMYVCMYVLNLNITISYMYICVLYCVQIHMWYMI